MPFSPTDRRCAKGEQLFVLRNTVVCVEELRFRFEGEEGAVILDGWAHRPAAAGATPGPRAACRPEAWF